jgi:hypothetical protein
MISLKHGGILLLLAHLSLPSQLYAAAPAPGQFDIDLKELDRQEPTQSPKSEKKKEQRAKKVRPAAVKADKVQPSAAGDSEPVRYTVQPGDHIFKILVVRFGLSNEAAERLIPEIIRVNNIPNIKRLTVGQTLLIPAKGQLERVAGSAKKGKSHKRKGAAEETAEQKAAEPAARGAGASPEVAISAPATQVAPAIPQDKKPVEPEAAGHPPAQTAPLAPSAVANVVAAVPSPPAVPQANTWICSVTEKNQTKIVDAFLNALSLPWSRNRIIESTAPTTFSIRVDRYFEYKGARYVVSIGESDPYMYTLIRLLESAGYRVLMISGNEDFEAIDKKLLTLIGVVPDFGKHVLQGGREATGFLVQQDDAGGRRVVITAEPADPQQKWVMPAGCGAR